MLSWFTAVENGDTSLMETMLQGNPALIDATDDKCWTSLHLSSAGGCDGAVDLLLAHCPTLINAVNREGSALHLAAAAGHAKVVERLLAQSSAELVASTDVVGYTALHLAAKGGHTRVVQLLLERASSALISAVDSCGWTALHVAVDKGHSDIVEQLLSKSSPEMILAADFGGSTVLHVAVEEGHHNLMERLIQREPRLVHAITRHGWTPLHLAALRDRPEIAQHLLAWSPALVGEVTTHGLSALHLAAAQGHERVVAQLLAHLRVFRSDDGERRSMRSGCRRGQRSATFWTVGADVFDFPSNDDNHNHKKRRVGETNVEHLNEPIVNDCPASLTPGLNNEHVEEEEEEEESPNEESSLDYVLDIMNEKGQTALHIAAGSGHEVIVDMLLAYDPGLVLATAKCNTVLHLCCATKKHQLVAKVLALNEAAVRSYNMDLETPFDVAVRDGDERVIEVLERKLSLEEVANSCYCDPVLLQHLHRDVARTVHSYLFRPPNPPPEDQRLLFLEPRSRRTRRVAEERRG